jgi:hypothetical protein
LVATTAVVVVCLWVHGTGSWRTDIFILIRRWICRAANLRIGNSDTTSTTVVVVSQKAYDLALAAFLLHLIGCVRYISATTTVIVVRVRAGKNKS